MGDFGATRDKWVCPNDRELSLRAKLKHGWSVKTNSINSFNKPEQLNDTEQEAIMDVIKRAETLEKVEQERVGRLVERLDNMKKNAMGNGSTQCVLCADEFGILGASPLPCNDCKKAVCTKCGVDTLSAQKEPLWMCKICAETRETWKKSGAWFYKGLPKYTLPGRKMESNKYSPTPSPAKPTSDQNTGSPVRSYNNWLQTKGRSGSEKEFTDSSDEEIKASRLSKKGTVRRQNGDTSEMAVTSSPVHYSMNQSQGSDLPLGPSPTHAHPQMTSESPRSPQYRDSTESSRPVSHEGAHVAFARDKRDFSPVPPQAPSSTGSYWYKPRREVPEEEETQERNFRGHARRESQHSTGSRHRHSNQNRGDVSAEEKPSPPEESSKKKADKWPTHRKSSALKSRGKIS